MSHASSSPGSMPHVPRSGRAAAPGDDEPSTTDEVVADEVDGEGGADADALEAALWHRFTTLADACARNELIERHASDARIVAALHYRRRIDDDIEFDDYLHWALLGLVEALDRFDPARGVRFRTYASHWMRGRILDGLDSATEKHRQIAARRRAREDRLADARRLAAGAGDPAKLLADGDPTALFAYLSEVGVGLAIGVILEGTGMFDPEATAATEVPDTAYERAELRQLRQRLHESLDVLTAQERGVIRSHYIHQHLFEQIAVDLGLTKGRISQIHRQALGKLRDCLRVQRRCDLSW